MLWFIYSLLSGFFFATSDAITKKVKLDDDYIIAWSRLFFSLPVVLVLLFFTTMPRLDSTFWLSIFFLAPLEITAILLYIKAIRKSPLSLTLPFLSLTPLFLILTSFILLGEFPTLLGIIGILLIVFGAYVLNLNLTKYRFLDPFKAVLREKGSMLMVIAAFIFSITSNLGKIAILHSNTLFFFVLQAFLLIAVLTILFFGRIRKKFAAVKSNIKLLSLTGITYGLMFFFHVVAITLVIVPYMISIKRTSSIFGVLYGHFWFKEKHITQRLFGAVIMILGAAIILLS
ncbi:DMT family transporter [Candidatus Woesearchaeota archaeon]|nr:DMT family transporter [Candidatus Woesearchaeota archaeon]